jgi:DNA-binding MurR/RpiR family transcriptional regulator
MACALRRYGVTDPGKTVNILNAAQAVHIVCVRRAFVVAFYFSYALRHIDRRAYLVDGIGGMFAQQTQPIKKSATVIAISFIPYVKETLEAAATALKKRSALIVITARPLSPMALQAIVSQVVKEAQVGNFYSLISSLYLAQTLSIGLAFCRQNNH